MAERKHDTTTDDSFDDGSDLAFNDFLDEDLDDEEPVKAVNDKSQLAAKRRAAERRLEALRLREELGDYDFDFDDDF